MDYTKMKQSYCELMLPTLVQTVTFSSPFQGHRQCDKQFLETVSMWMLSGTSDCK